MTYGALVTCEGCQGN